MMRGSVRIYTVLVVDESWAIVLAVNTTYNSYVVYMYFIYGKVCEYYILDTTVCFADASNSKQQTLNESVIKQNRANASEVTESISDQ
jgi:hypothetical protein